MFDMKSPSEVSKFLSNCSKIKPDLLVMDDLKWKLLVRSAIRGRNILLIGPTGSGKTLAAKSLAEATKRKDRFFSFNLGSTQDPRSTLIGNTQFNKDTGTYFGESEFIRAIRTPRSVILLDEITRAHPEAWNILMSVLDPIQRYIRLDESTIEIDITDDETGQITKQNTQETVQVAEGVVFVATANIGNEYTSTRQIDRAISDRFTKIEVDLLTKEQEFDLLIKLAPEAHKNTIKDLCEIVAQIRQMYFGMDQKLTNFVSTRSAVEMATLIEDGFSLMDVASALIYPEFDSDGGTDSERVVVKQIVQKFVSDGDNADAPWNSSPF